MRLELNGVFLGELPQNIGEHILEIIQGGYSDVRTVFCEISPCSYDDSYIAIGKSETLFSRTEKQKFNIDLQLQVSNTRIIG